MYQLWAAVFASLGVLLLLLALFVMGGNPAAGFAVSGGLCIVAAAIVVRGGDSDARADFTSRILSQATRIKELERERAAHVLPYSAQPEHSPPERPA